MNGTVGTPSPETTPQDAIDAIIAALIRTASPQEIIQARLAPQLIAIAAAASNQSDTVSDQILDNLYPSGLPPTEAFYEKLAELEFRLGWSSETRQLAGTLWARAFVRLRNDHERELLYAMIDPGTHFFPALHALSAFLQRCPVSRDVLVEWLLAVRKKLGNDMAAGGFWDGLQSLSDAFPDSALFVAQQFSSKPSDDDAITMAAAILGHLRISHPQLIGLEEFQRTLRDHPDVKRRLVFHRSWITTGFRQALSEDEFQNAIERMSAGTVEEVDECFNFIRCLLPLESTSDESFVMGVQWLHQQTSGSVSDSWKHFLLSLTVATYGRWRSSSLSPSVPPLYDLAVTIQPIPAKNVGTWRELERLFIALLKTDQAEFRRVLFDIARTNPIGLLQQFRSFDEFKTLTSDLRQSYGADLATDALLSDDEDIRNLGFTIFDAVGLEHLPIAKLRSASDNAIATIIFAFRLQPFYDEVIARFLLALLPRVSHSSAALKQLLIGEMIFQCKNLPGGCLKLLKKRAKRSALVRKAVNAAENYFTRLKLCHGSAINSMDVPGLERAMRLKAVRESRALSTQMKEKSVFTQLFTTSYTLYGGKSWQTFFGGNLGEISEMKQISHSAEVPRMPSIDPDGMAQRAHEARGLIRQLITRLQTSNDDQ